MNTTAVLLMTASLAALAIAAPVSTPLPTVDTPLPSATVSSILSINTRRFLMFSADGNVTANGHHNTPETEVYIEYLNGNKLRIQSLSTMDYLIFENETFLGSTPSDDNDIFELVRVGDESLKLKLVAFRVVRRNLTMGNSSEADNNTAGTESESVGESEIQMKSESESDEMDTAIQTESEELGEQASECYLGFADETSEPRCYPSTGDQFPATIFRINE